jgi:hypothetical protein
VNDSEKRRCPWCWEWIERSAAVCEHCKKDVPAREDRRSVSESQGGAAHTLASDQALDISLDTARAEPLVDLSSLPGQLMWWGTGILIYGVLLFGVALAYPSPKGSIALLLVAAQLGAAFFFNRVLWARMKAWPISKVTRTIVVLAIVVALLVVLGWVRRQFLS